MNNLVGFTIGEFVGNVFTGSGFGRREGQCVVIRANAVHVFLNHGKAASFAAFIVCRTTRGGSGEACGRGGTLIGRRSERAGITFAIAVAKAALEMTFLCTGAPAALVF
jgi:hypothetical protein